MAFDVPEYCKKGPVAWCQNFNTSVECHAGKYCQETVWLVQEPTTGSCGSCETEIQEIRIVFKMTSINLTELPERTCYFNSDMRYLLRGCHVSGKRYLPHQVFDWMNLLASNIHPATVCQVLGVCSNDSISSKDVLSSESDLSFPSTIVVESAKPLVTQRCLWSSYLCNNLTSSRKCKSTSQCIRRVWSKLQYLKDNDSVCLVCEDMVKQARIQLQSNESLKELRRSLRASCKLILVKEVLHECLRLADNFLPELTKMLVSQLTPTAICTVADLCNNTRIDSLLRTAKEPVLIRTNPRNGSGLVAIHDDSLCFFCQYFLHFVQEELEKPEEQQKIEEAMNRTCELAPTSIRSECQSFVFQYGPLMISLFSQKIDPSLVCPAIEVCPHNASLEERCHQCLTLMENMTATLGDNFTDQHVLQMLDSVMTVSNWTQVAVEIKNNHQHLINLLRSPSEPSVMCVRLRLCSPQMVSLSFEQMSFLLINMFNENSQQNFHLSMY